MKKHTKISAILVAAILALTTTACRPASAPSPEPTTKGGTDRLTVFYATIDTLADVVSQLGADSTIIMTGQVTENDILTIKNIISNSQYKINFSLKNVIGLSTIPDYGFYGCNCLKHIELPDTLTTMGEWVFTSCENLESIVIPDSVTSIDTNTFAYCYELTSVSLPNSLTHLPTQMFVYCKKLREINIPTSITTMGVGVFLGCSSLKTITIPTSITSLPSSTFNQCTKLEEITIPDTITRIEICTFRNCDSLTEISIPASVTFIGERVFEECSSLQNINVSSNNNNYSSIDGVLFNKDKTQLINYPGGRIGPYTIPNSVETIIPYAFEDCDLITSVTIPSTVTTIDSTCFQFCDSLTSFIVDSQNSYFSSVDGFLLSKGKDELVSFPGGLKGACTIPNTVTTINYRSINFCTNLTSLTIPSSVNKISRDSFYGCDNLSSITFSDSSNWYRTDNSTDWNNKENGTQTELTNPETNANYFNSRYNSYYWYKN